ncbi:conserved hypothetical protein [Nostocoides australiense Ben110]|uniref:Uncharacterized protein n=2 Tax=Nostocoides australiense TaxID=99480 RepID=W6JXZ0_9MICO|nr:conserved hypothetical protein [Tetrasphaera australiensis Ben110]
MAPHPPPTEENDAMTNPSDTIEPWVRELLRCPKCLTTLRDDSRDGAPELVCESAECGLAYPVEDGIPVLLIDKARPRG